MTYSVHEFRFSLSEPRTLQLSKSAKRAGARGYAVADFIVNGGFKGIIAHFAFPKMPHGVFITVF